MPNYRRLVSPHRTIFFTVAAADRRGSAFTDHIDALRAAIVDTRRKFPFAIDAFVVLPEQLHCIWTLPQNNPDFSVRWRLIKSRFSRKVAASLWQKRFWDHVIRNEDDFARHFDYIHNNPVKHGHVERAADWPYSTFHRYVRDGIYTRDWGCETDSRGDYGE